VTRLIGLVLGLLAVFPASAQVHVPSSASSDNFLASSAVPAIWLPELDAGIPMSGARVFIPGHVDAGRGVPLAFALDGGSIPLTINVGPSLDHNLEGGWVPLTNMAVAHGFGVGGAVRSVVSLGAYRFFVYDGDAQLDDVSRDPRLGSDQATGFEPLGLIYAAYIKNLNAYHAISTDGGIAYDTNFTGGSAQGKQAQFPGNVTAVAGISETPNLLVGTTTSDTIDHAALHMVDRNLKSPIPVDDGVHVGGTLDGLAVYHAHDRGDGGVGDWALVSSDGHLLLYEVTSTDLISSVSFITELIIDSADPAPYFQGVTISNQALGAFDKGVAVVFDATDTSTGAGQLLYVRWDDIVSAVDAGLAIDTSFDVRAFNLSSGPNTSPTVAHPPLGTGIGGPTSLMSGSCGGTAGPMMPVAGALILLGGFAGRRRR